MRRTTETQRTAERLSERLSHYGYPTYLAALAPCGHGVAEHIRERLTGTPAQAYRRRVALAARIDRPYRLPSVG